MRGKYFPQFMMPLAEALNTWRISFTPPENMDITPFLPEEEPSRSLPLERLGLNEILDGLKINFHNNRSVFLSFSPTLKSKLTFNQAYVIMCNCLHSLNRFVGEIYKPTTLEPMIRSNFAKIISYLISLEGRIGDFGQMFDFRSNITMEDFGLDEFGGYK